MPNPGIGITFNLIITGSSAAIAEVQDVDLPELEKFLADATTHGSSGSYAEWGDSGMKAQGEMKLVLLYDATTHAAFNSAFDRSSGVAFRLVLPGSEETIYSECHVAKIGRVSKQKDLLKANVTIQPTGKPTIT